MKIEYTSEYSIVTPSTLFQRVQQIDQKRLFNMKEVRQENSQDKMMTLKSQSLNLTKTFKKKNNKKDQLGLKKLIKQQKINNIIKRFIAKLKLNNINSNAVQFQPFEKDDKQSLISNLNGIQISDIWQKILSILIALQIILCMLIDTTAIIFPQVLDYFYIRIIQYFSLTIFSIQFITSCTVVKLVQGKKIQKIPAIIAYYLQDGLIIDLAYLVVLIGGMVGDFHVFRLIILFKLPECFQRIQKLQNLLVNTFYKEQYWGLTKVFLLNFAFAHFLSIFLLSMSNINKNDNWMTKFNIDNSSWYQKYIWGYYWGTTIMLTVGFGDITVANYQQAICIVLIQTFSCLALAYNINCVGSLITNIKSQDIQKNRNIKTFKIISTRNNISEDLEMKIHNYIQESTNIKKKFNFAQESNFISTLPSQIKADFLKESNKKIFQNLYFFKNLTEKTLLSFAQIIQMKIYHPEQVIKKRGEFSGLLILKQGKIGYCTKTNGSQFNNVTIQSVCIQQNQNPFIISLDFLSMEACSYEVKSQQYSIMYFLNRQKTLETLKTGELDYEHYCFLRDKAKYLSTQFQVFKCEFCKSNHTKFDCPKLHFIPLKMHVLDKYLFEVKHSKNQRFQNFSRKKKRFAPLKELQGNLKYFQIYEKHENKRFMQWRKSKKSISIAEESLNKYLVVDSIKNMMQKDWSSVTLNKSRAGQIEFCLDKVSQEQLKKKLQVSKLISLMKDQLLQIFQKEQEKVWIIQCDQVKNFKFYFVNFNASQLQKEREAPKNHLV